MPAASFILAVQGIVGRNVPPADTAVLSVGHIAGGAFNAPNVIPGIVRITIELRDLSNEKLLEILADIRQRAAAIATASRTRIDITDLSANPPALAAEDVQRAIERAAGSLGLSKRRQPRGAGHDAQMMAQLGPMGMIFVPSVGGISHSPRELTKWEDCANGANVLQLTDRPGAPHLNPVPNPGWGLHLTDANIALGNLIALVKRQIKAFGGVAGISAR